MASRAALRLRAYADKHINSGSFEPLKQVMVTIGCASFVAECFHHDHMAKLQVIAAEKQKNALLDSRNLAAQALKDNRTEIEQTKETIQLSHQIIDQSKQRIAELEKQQVSPS
mmetsp:Transcript_2238/g.5200  ORF Transcript_2238/g.5200 Transcript_2238/m.5200 type:complete len:113 (+) Transcript_2238:110-448(+)